MKEGPPASLWGGVALTVALLLGPGCQPQGKTATDADPVESISMRDRVRLDLADADSVGIHMLDLKKMRADLIKLKDTEPDLADLLLSDLDRVEALPKTDVLARVAIGKEMYARIRKDR